MTEAETPEYMHDCEKCTFLGHFQGHDLYFCPQGNLPTVIARFGDDGSSYMSGLLVADRIPELAEAKRRAQERKLLP